MTANDPILSERGGLGSNHWRSSAHWHGRAAEAGIETVNS